MVAVPARISGNYVVQDNRGFKALVRFNGYIADVSAGAATLAAYYANFAALGTALQATTNAKVVESGMSLDWAIAQQPTTETGTYELVIQKAKLNFGDGTVERSHVSIPAPKDALFLTSASDNLVVINPAAATLTALQAAINTALSSPAGPGPASQFFGGQLVEGKPRRRRVLQGA